MFLGVTNYLGELGGNSKIGRPFITDLELSMTRPSVGLFYRYNLNSYISVRVTSFEIVVVMINYHIQGLFTLMSGIDFIET